ncbi:MAG: Hpt domain-containing protein [Gammaproteobacteria bacterium]|nr:Hpt domain-containing protein [Gammaproteobacteria bacterium]
MSEATSPLEDIDPIVRGLLPGYLKRREEELVRLTALLENKDFADIRVLGHNLSGSGGAYGLPQLTDFGRRIESAARDKDEQALRREFAQLGDFLQIIREKVA